MAVAVAALVTVFMAELGDKTQLIIMAMACRYPALNVLTGALLALGASLGLAVLAGGLVYSVIPQNLLVIISGVIFILSGLCYGFFQKEQEKEGLVHCEGGLAQTMCLVFLAELGDKSQLAALMLTAGTGRPIAVFAGAFLAILLHTLLAVFLGNRIVARLKPSLLKAGTAILFVVIGLVMILREIL